MSLESIIEANTKAVQELTATLKAVSNAAPAAPVAPAKSPSVAAPAAAPTTEPVATSVVVTLEYLQAKLQKIVQVKGRDAAVKLLGDFKVPKVSALAADKYVDFSNAADKVLA